VKIYSFRHSSYDFVLGSITNCNILKILDASVIHFTIGTVYSQIIIDKNWNWVKDLKRLDENLQLEWARGSKTGKLNSKILMFKVYFLD
jgi:hypothetical protein